MLWRFHLCLEDIFSNLGHKPFTRRCKFIISSQNPMVIFLGPTYAEQCYAFRLPWGQVTILGGSDSEIWYSLFGLSWVWALCKFGVTTSQPWWWLPCKKLDHRWKKRLRCAGLKWSLLPTYVWVIYCKACLMDGHQNTVCYDETGPCVQNIDINLGPTMNIIDKVYVFINWVRKYPSFRTPDFGY